MQKTKALNWLFPENVRKVEKQADSYFLGGGSQKIPGGKPEVWLALPSERCRMTLSRVEFLTLAPGRVGCHFLLQGIFLTQGLNPGLLHCRQILYHVSQQESLRQIIIKKLINFLQCLPLWSTLSTLHIRDVYSERGGHSRRLTQQTLDSRLRGLVGGMWHGGNWVILESQRSQVQMSSQLFINHVILSKSFTLSGS